MKNRGLLVDKNGLELGTRGSWDFPVQGGRGFVDLGRYPDGRFECHYHPETELTLILSGEMYYRADDRVFLLHAGDAVFVNANVMHAGWQNGGADCHYLPINFSPVMVFGRDGSRIEQRYVEPMLRDNLLPAEVFFAASPDDGPALALVEELRGLLTERADGYELLVTSALCRFWHLLYGRVQGGREAVCPDRGVPAVKKAIAYMEAHYEEKLTLSDLAAAGGFSRSEFCRTFHRITGRTPFSYLQYLRVRRSLALLQDASVSVTEVAARSGFSGASYYAEIFRRYIGMSPLAYRRHTQG